LQGWLDDAQLSSLLHDSVDAFEAGAPFPDWGYRCGCRIFAAIVVLLLIERSAARTMATTFLLKAKLHTGASF
jgi:hypothetical protein